MASCWRVVRRGGECGEVVIVGSSKRKAAVGLVVRLGLTAAGEAVIVGGSKREAAVVLMEWGL